MLRTKLLEEADGLSESSESVLLLVVEEEDEDIKTPSWVDFTIVSMRLKTSPYFWNRETKNGAFEEMLKEYLKRGYRCNGYI